MGVINYGQQKISFTYKEPAQSQLFNNNDFKVLPRGIYSGGVLSRINDTTVNVSPLICVFEDTNATVTARIETTINVGITVAPATPYIVLRFVWINTTGNYADIVATSFSGIGASDIILGRLNFLGSVMTTEYDFCRKSWSNPYLNNSLGYLPDYLVTSNEPYDTKVTVSPGPQYVVDGKLSQLTTATLSSAFSLPAGSNGRTDLVCLNGSSQVVIVPGDNVVGLSVIPAVDDGLTLLAVVTFPANASTVHGSYISYFNPKYFKSGQISGTNSPSFHLDKSNSGPILKNSGGVLLVRNTTDTALARVTLADGVGVNDAVSMEQLSSEATTRANADSAEATTRANADASLVAGLQTSAQQIVHTNVSVSTDYTIVSVHGSGETIYGSFTIGIINNVVTIRILLPSTPGIWAYNFFYYLYTGSFSTSGAISGGLSSASPSSVMFSNTVNATASNCSIVGVFTLKQVN